MKTVLSKQDVQDQHNENRLQEEIALLEARLHTMGLDGDCAYERALSRVYDTLLAERRERLAAMRAAGL